MSSWAIFSLGVGAVMGGCVVLMTWRNDRLRGAPRYRYYFAQLAVVAVALVAFVVLIVRR